MKQDKVIKFKKNGPAQKGPGKVKTNKTEAAKNLAKAKPAKAENKEMKGKKQKADSELQKQKVPKEKILPVKETSDQKDDAAKIEKKKAKKMAKKVKKEVMKKEKNEAILKQQKKATSSSGDTEHQKRDPTLDAATVFVGNLPVSTKRIQIVKLFAKYGGIKGIRLRTAAGQVIFKHKQRKQAGSLNAYVVLNSPQTADKALELNGLEFKGVTLRVTPSDKEQNKKTHDPKRTVFVGNLKYTANEEKLREIFSNCGEIDYIRCLYDGKNKCRGTGYVCFKSPEAVGLAMELNETVLDERPIHVERYSVKKLGAKEKRDKETSSNQKSGAKKRIDLKKKGQKAPASDVKDKKKSEFRGVKVSGIKKNKNKKKPTNEMKTIAKRIAPKTKTQEA